MKQMHLAKVWWGGEGRGAFLPSLDATSFQPLHVFTNLEAAWTLFICCWIQSANITISLFVSTHEAHWTVISCSRFP